MISVRATKTLLLVGMVGALACAAETTGTLELVSGEGDLWTRSPAPTRLVVETVSQQGTRGLVDVPLPLASLDLPALSTDEVAAFQVRGLDEAGVTRVWGRTLPQRAGALAEATLPVFVQRTGALAELPGSLPAAVTGAASPLRLAVAEGHLLVVATPEGGAFYDLVGLTASSRIIPWPRPPRSFAVRGTTALVLDEGGASLVDLGTGDARDLPASEIAGEGSFAEVAGGATVEGDDGTLFVVGPTRDDAPSHTVLRIDARGVFTFVPLRGSRRGAAAAWLRDAALVVVEGIADGALPAMERVDGAPGTSPPADGGGAAEEGRGVRGAAAVDLGGGRALLVGGTNGAGQPVPAVVVNVACMCRESAGAAVAPPFPLPLTAVEAHPLTTAAPGGQEAPAFLVVGDDDTPAGHAYVLRLTGTGRVDEVALPTAHRATRSVRGPNGAIFLAGGDAPRLASFSPLLPP